MPPEAVRESLFLHIAHSNQRRGRNPVSHKCELNPLLLDNGQDWVSKKVPLSPALPAHWSISGSQLAPKRGGESDCESQLSPARLESLFSKKRGIQQ